MSVIKKLVLKSLGRRDPKPYLRNILGPTVLRGVDIGGAYGLPSHWGVLMDIARFYVFEPHEASRLDLVQRFSTLNHPEWVDVIGEAVSDREGEQTLYCTSVPTGSSILPFDFDEDVFRYVSRDSIYPIEEVKIKTRKLETILSEKSVLSVDMIKLDIQGHEMAALKSLGEKYLNSLLTLEIEVNATPLVKNRPTLEDFNAFLLPMGFELFDMRASRAHCHPSAKGSGHYQQQLFGTCSNPPSMNARIWEYDLVYFKKPSVLFEKKDKDGLVKLAVSYLTYNYFLEAVDLIERAAKENILSSAEKSVIIENIVEYYRARYSNPMYQQGPLGKFLRKCAGKLKLDRRTVWARYMWVDFPSS